MTTTTKSVFITGGTSGIGLVTARQLAALGWRVVAAGLPTDDLAALQAAAPANLQFSALDITDAAAVTQAAAPFLASGMDALVHSAGISLPAPLEGLTPDALRRQFEVNVIGHLRVTQAFLPALRQRPNARIVILGSLMGRVALPLLGAYSMSKHALEALADGLRLELAPDKMHVALVQPGAIATPMTDAMPEHLERTRQQLPESLQTRYANLYAGMRRTLEAQAKTALSPQLVAACIVHALTARKPKTRYAVGAAAWGLMLMRRFAPDEIGDAILRRALGIG